jgi:hypothetical protein
MNENRPWAGNYRTGVIFMMKTNHRRRTIRLVSYALAAMLVLGGFLWRSEG